MIAARTRCARRGLRAVALIAVLSLLPGCADTTNTAAAALTALTDVYPPPSEIDCGEVGWAACMAEASHRRLNGGPERAEEQEAGEPVFIAELSRDDLLRYAADNEEALELGRQVCRFVDAGRTGEVTDLLAEAGFGTDDAALFMGAAGATMCPGG